MQPKPAVSQSQSVSVGQSPSIEATRAPAGAESWSSPGIALARQEFSFGENWRPRKAKGKNSTTTPKKSTEAKQVQTSPVRQAVT